MAMSDFDRIFDGAYSSLSTVQSTFSGIQSDFDKISEDLSNILIDLDSILEPSQTYCKYTVTSPRIIQTNDASEHISWSIVKTPDNKTYISGTMGTKKVRIPLSTLQNLTDDQIEDMITGYFNNAQKNLETEDNDDMEEDPEASVDTMPEIEDPKPERDVIPLGSPTPKEGKYPIKWVNGNIYKLRVRGRFGIRGYERKYVLKKFIYNVKNVAVNVVIMKQLTGPRSTTFTLSKTDCIRFHIKYEEGLQVMSMAMNWIPCKDLNMIAAS